MNNITRKLKFSSKVKIERETLSLINSSHFSKKYKLAGMTKEAILNWENTIKTESNEDELSEIINTTLAISRNAHIISDTSKTVFAEGSYFNDDKYIKDQQKLKILLNLN